jgi:hypothetical protein
MRCKSIMTISTTRRSHHGMFCRFKPKEGWYPKGTMDDIRSILRHLLVERANQAGITKEDIEKQESFTEILSATSFASSTVDDHGQATISLQSKVNRVTQDKWKLL